VPYKLNNFERDVLLTKLETDGFVVIPEKLDKELLESAQSALNQIMAEGEHERKKARCEMDNIINVDPAFRHLMTYYPAMQLAHDVFGPSFHLCSSSIRYRKSECFLEPDFAMWHSDGPRPKQFPVGNGAPGLNILKFVFFLTDSWADSNCGSIQVIRGSHKKLELDGKRLEDFRIEDYQDDLISLNCEAGTVVMFHQALWYQIPPNRTDNSQLEVIVTYCPSWMRPFDRDFPKREELKGLSREERWLLSEPRYPVKRWWMPTEQDLVHFKRYGRE